LRRLGVLPILFLLLVSVLALATGNASIIPDKPILFLLLVSVLAGSRHAVADAGVTLLSSSSFTDSIGAFHVVGEVRNDTGQAIEFVNIIGTFTDSAGNFLATEDTFTTLDVLAAGDIAPFDLLLTTPPAGISQYSLQTQWEPASDVPFQGISLVGDARVSLDSIGFTHIAGQVRNDGSAPAKFVQIIATFYAADGTVVGTDFTFASLDTIQPGQVSPYELVTEPTRPYSNYRLQVQAESS